MSDEKPLAVEVWQELIPRLKEFSTTTVFLAYADDVPVGVAIRFLGFSTFAARPLLNIHDLAVLPAHRGKKIGRESLRTVERKADELGCCKVTLKVLEKNFLAKGLYESAGFSQAEHGSEAGKALFMSRPLESS